MIFSQTCKPSFVSPFLLFFVELVPVCYSSWERLPVDSLPMACRKNLNLNYAVIDSSQGPILPPKPERLWSCTRTCWCYLVAGHGQARILYTNPRDFLMKYTLTHPLKTGKPQR